MSSLHGIPRHYGMVVIILGLVFFFPLLGFIVELINDLSDKTGWSILMFGLTIVAIVASIFMIGFGTNIIWYYDKRINDDRTLEEKAEDSEFKPRD